MSHFFMTGLEVWNQLWGLDHYWRFVLELTKRAEAKSSGEWTWDLQISANMFNYTEKHSVYTYTSTHLYILFLVGGLEHFLFPIDWECHHPN